MRKGGKTKENETKAKMRYNSPAKRKWWRKVCGIISWNILGHSQWKKTWRFRPWHNAAVNRRKWHAARLRVFWTRGRQTFWKGSGRFQPYGVCHSNSDLPLWCEHSWAMCTPPAWLCSSSFVYKTSGIWPGGCSLPTPAGKLCKSCVKKR